MIVALVNAPYALRNLGRPPLNGPRPSRWCVHTSWCGGVRPPDAETRNRRHPRGGHPTAGTTGAALATIMRSVGERGRWFEEPRLPRAHGSRCDQGRGLACWQACTTSAVVSLQSLRLRAAWARFEAKVRCCSNTETVATMRDPWCAEPTVHGSNRKALAALKDRGLHESA